MIQTSRTTAMYCRGMWLPSSIRIVAGVSRVPVKSMILWLCLSGRGASSITWIVASNAVDGFSQLGAVIKSPRFTSTWSIPLRLTATRVPGPTLSCDFSCTCRLRILALLPEGRISTSSPVFNVPPVSVPVTTAPKPVIEKDRSTGNLGLPVSDGLGNRDINPSSAVFSSSMPSPFSADTART